MFKKQLPMVQTELKKYFKIDFYHYSNQKDPEKFSSKITYVPFILIVINGNVYEYKGNRTTADFVKFIKARL
jgi:hypothetical protein